MNRRHLLGLAVLAITPFMATSLPAQERPSCCKAECPSPEKVATATCTQASVKAQAKVKAQAQSKPKARPRARVTKLVVCVDGKQAGVITLDQLRALFASATPITLKLQHGKQTLQLQLTAPPNGDQSASKAATPQGQAATICCCCEVYCCCCGNAKCGNGKCAQCGDSKTSQKKACCGSGKASPSKKQLTPTTTKKTTD